MNLPTDHPTWGALPQFFSLSGVGLSRELLVSALFSTSCGVTVADVRQGGAPLILCNPAFLRLTGYMSAEVLGRNCRFLQGPDTDPDRIQAIREALREGRHLRVVLKNYRKDGSPFWNELNLSPIYDGSGVLTHFVGVQNDITPQKRAEESLLTLNGELDARVKGRTHALSEALKLVATSRERALWIVGLALEYRDYETKGHTERVTALAGGLGQALGLSGGELSDLRWGSYLHDAGKVALPDAVLLKPGPLTAEEFGLMQRHVLIGEAMLQELTFLPRRVLGVVRYHHERWDGGGYPDGLAGEQIPLLARVFSVADVYDALTSVRPYKAAWTHEEAVAEIVRGRGVQFDPRVVDVFVETVGR